MEVIIEPEKTMEAEADRAKANTPKDHIPGWGHDANPENDPTYPMKNWNGADHQRFNYQKPRQQPVNIEVFHSNERPGVSRVFGTSTPPEGLSGAVRRYAFKYSESSYMHWMPLVMADRMDVVKGIIKDLAQGIIPNIFVENGWRAAWKYNKKGLIQKVAIRLVIATAVILLMSRKRKKLSL